MNEGEALVDLLLTDLFAVCGVVGLYLVYVKLRSFFRGFQALKTEHYVRSRLGMPRLAEYVRGGRGSRKSHSSSGSPLFWVKYATRRGLARAIHRFTLERRVFGLLKKRQKQELDKIAFSLMFWRRKDCPDDELYVARPPHHIALLDEETVRDPRIADERQQRMLALKGKSSKEVMAWLKHDIRRRSSVSVRWLCDSLEGGWVDDLGRTKSRAIRLTEENELGMSCEFRDSEAERTRKRGAAESPRCEVI